jgi:hypothetical protein
MDRSNLGGYTPGGPDKVLATESIGNCWCTTSYFDDGTPTLVSSGGKLLHLWTVQGKPTTTLVSRAAPTAMPPSQVFDKGFFTSVSSNQKNDTIVWAVTRPVSPDDPRVWLYGFAVGLPGTALRQIFAAPAGTWNFPTRNPNLVPTIANGRVYVAGSGGLSIFGLAPPAAGTSAQ